MRDGRHCGANLREGREYEVLYSFVYNGVPVYVLEPEDRPTDRFDPNLTYPYAWDQDRFKITGGQ